jgi:excisionase family DNA binding protein
MHQKSIGADADVSAQHQQSRPSPKLLYSREEAAELLSVSVRTIDYMIANKQLPTRRYGRRRLIPYQALLQCTRRDFIGRVQ